MHSLMDRDKNQHNQHHREKPTNTNLFVAVARSFPFGVVSIMGRLNLYHSSPLATECSVILHFTKSCSRPFGGYSSRTHW
jgi:hypothetical protein